MMFASLHKFVRWLLLTQKGEPSGPFCGFIIGVVLIIVGSVLAMSVGVHQGLWSFVARPRVESWALCGPQFESSSRREKDLQDQIKISDCRRLALKKALTDIRVPAFVDAPAALRTEEAANSDLRRRLEALKVEPLIKFLRPFAIGLGMVILFALIIARLVTMQGMAAIGAWNSRDNGGNWIRPYLLFMAIIFLTHMLREISTSILTTDKTWFGWSSFCISSYAWALMLIPALGFAMVVAYPATILWHFGRVDNRPKHLDREHKDGQWGVGRYVLFLQTWSVLSLAFLVLPGALWLRFHQNDLHLSRAYLLTFGVLFASILIITGRFIGNAIEIRKAYKLELEKLGDTWQKIKEAAPPPDPTTRFLGEHWWQLPAVISGIFAISWLIIEQVGVSDFLSQVWGAK